MERWWYLTLGVSDKWLWFIMGFCLEVVIVLGVAILDDIRASRRERK